MFYVEFPEPETGTVKLTKGSEETNEASNRRVSTSGEIFTTTDVLLLLVTLMPMVAQVV
jgi:hypothetical protein